jgi:mRNA-degrading endonuclease toxin of MazEF toxin-antitoxin module
MAIQRGEIYFVNLNPVKGREQAGHRPVLVLSIDAINKLPLVVTAEELWELAQEGQAYDLIRSFV